jgi:NDP-sugar pyrophosphorylase family protein
MAFNHALIMAAGRGTRMLPLTEAIPKPMAPFRDSTLIADSIKNIIAHIPNIHITIGYKKAMLAAHVIELGVASVLNTEGKSNSWWIYNTLMRYVDEPVVVLTCDNITTLDFAALEEDYLALGAPACMLVPVTPIRGLEGDFIHHVDYFVHEVDRHKAAQIYCSGIQILNPSLVASSVVEGHDFYDVWRGLIALKQLKVSRRVLKKWFTVDTLEQLMAVNASTERIA